MVLLLLVWFQSGAWAQETLPNAMTLHDCMAYVIKLSAFQQEAYQLSTKQFENGLISAIEYQTASQTYLNAMAERVNALLLLKLKEAVVRYYQGEPLQTHVIFLELTSKRGE